MLNFSQGHRESGFTPHLILLAKVSSFPPTSSQHTFFTSLMEGKTDTYQVYTQFFLLQLCIQHLFCGQAELLSAVLTATHLS